MRVHNVEWSASDKVAVLYLTNGVTNEEKKMGMGSLASAAAKSALVLKEIKINEEGPHYVHIVARQAGVFAFILSIIGIDSTTVFDVYADRLEFIEGSLSGRMNTCMPLSSVSVATSGFVKPFMWLILGIPLSFVCIGIPMVIGYFLSKSLVVSVTSNGGQAITICLKRSVIEGVEMNEETAFKIVQIIKDQTLTQTAKA